MTEGDDVLDLLRRARPDDLPRASASPHQPAAQALLEEILTMPTTRTHHVPAEADASPEATIASPARRRRRAGLLGAAAAAVALVVAADMMVGGPARPSAAAAVDAAVAASSQALESSGRVEIDRRITYSTDPTVIDQNETWAFSGEDVAVAIDGEEIGRLVDEQGYALHPPTECIVEQTDDGEAVYYGPGDGEAVWHHQGDDAPWIASADGVASVPSPPDLQSLLDALRAAGGFEDMGDVDVDGVPTRRLRAVDPAGLAPSALGLGSLVPSAATAVDDLEVWVDDSDLVRRIDLVVTGELDLSTPEALGGTGEREIEGFTYDATVAFSDLGEPVTIEAPADAVAVPSADCGGTPEG